MKSSTSITNSPVKKKPTDMNRHISKDETQMPTDIQKTCSGSAALKIMQISTIRYFPHTR